MPTEKLVAISVSIEVECDADLEGWIVNIIRNAESLLVRGQNRERGFLRITMMMCCLVGTPERTNREASTTYDHTPLPQATHMYGRKVHKLCFGSLRH